jgi:putative hydrolase of the HAD superfamily
MDVKVIAFDADDTLWENEHYFKHTEETFCALFHHYCPEQTAMQVLNETALENISLYGFGIKSFVLSMIEAGMKIAGGTPEPRLVEQLIALGKDMMHKPVALMEGIEEVLSALQPHYRLIVATKGDLLDQERKLRKSGLAGYFHHVEIMSEKDENSYRKLVRHLAIQPAELLMVGNSLKSDIIPVLNIGGHAIHIPYHITNVFEQATPVTHPRCKQLVSAREILQYMAQ